MFQIPPELYHQIFTSTPVGLAVSDEQGYIVTANDYLLRVGGYTMDDLRGKMASDLYEGGAVQRREITDKVMRQGQLDDFELRFKKKDGSLFKASMSLRMAVTDGRRYMIAMIREL